MPLFISIKLSACRLWLESFSSFSSQILSATQRRPISHFSLSGSLALLLASLTAFSPVKHEPTSELCCIRSCVSFSGLLAPSSTPESRLKLECAALAGARGLPPVSCACAAAHSPSGDGPPRTAPTWRASQPPSLFGRRWLLAGSSCATSRSNL